MIYFCIVGIIILIIIVLPIGISLMVLSGRMSREEEEHKE